VNTPRLAGTRLLWFVLGTAAVLAAGCTGINHSTVLAGARDVTAASGSATSDISVSSFKCPSAASSNNCPTVFGTVVTSGIAPTQVEIRRGGPGENGPSVVTLMKTGDNVWSVPPGTTLTDAQYSDYLAGRMYVDVQSGPNRAGELRAQLKP
jgi:hypothetical protein